MVGLDLSVLTDTLNGTERRKERFVYVSPYLIGHTCEKTCFCTSIDKGLTLIHLLYFAACSTLTIFRK